MNFIQTATGAVQVRRPTVDNAGARALLDCEDWQLTRIVDEGLIRGVVNIAAASTERRQLRYAVVAIEEYRRGQLPERTDVALTEIIFGKPQTEVAARWVYRALNFTPAHFYRLTTAKVIRTIKGKSPHAGPGGSAFVAWGELVRFVEQRRVA